MFVGEVNVISALKNDCHLETEDLEGHSWLIKQQAQKCKGGNEKILTEVDSCGHKLAPFSYVGHDTV